MQFGMQAEYTNSATLEARLQNVGRRMVSTTPRRPDSAERATPTPPHRGPVVAAMATLHIS